MVRYGMQVGKKSQKCKWIEMQKLTEMRQVVSLCLSYNHKQINHEAGDVRLQNSWKRSRFELLEGILWLQKRGHFFFLSKTYRSKIF